MTERCPCYFGQYCRQHAEPQPKVAPRFKTPEWQAVNGDLGPGIPMLNDEVAPEPRDDCGPDPWPESQPHTRWVEWVEPFFESEPVYMRIKAETAINMMKSMHAYANDEDALMDFVAVHWAGIAYE